ncbi:glycosyltransferase [Sediminicola luteus]|uniref:Glycosyltransferase n=1 Tax=Sediminicola luteus TaxID=319238 RepID=A0A2A4G401_9FLAO|nr:glycosyltransferase [Sediminicola luteus]PCE62704.1 glycosyltransferase [Sediminicola luteus]
MQYGKRILVAPLNWGLGHATRCIPLIQALENHGFIPIIGSDGVALELLKKEFPHLEYVALPSYKIKYAKKGKHFKLKMIWDSPKMIKAIRREKKELKKMIAHLELDGIISDNRLGIYSKKIPSVFITHQLNVLTGNTTWMSSKMHQRIIKKFVACWVPDVAGKPNLTGKLGHLKKSKGLHIKYLGPLSRLNKEELPKIYDLMVLISGPEPQRSMFEEKVMVQLQKFKGKALVVRGVIEEEQRQETLQTESAEITVFNFMQTQQLQLAFNQSNQVLSRSGYTTVMDLAKLGKKAFFIPTPGQYEQEYLAERLQKQGLVPYATQEGFTLSELKRIADYKGLDGFPMHEDYSALFSVFSAFSKVKENSEPTSLTLST